MLQKDTVEFIEIYNALDVKRFLLQLDKYIDMAIVVTDWDGTNESP